MSTTVRPVFAAASINSGKSMQRLRTEHDVDERRTFADALAFLAGHAATDANPDVGILFL